MNPDGSAVHVHGAAHPITGRGLVVWGVGALLCGPLVSVALLGVFVSATRPHGPRRPGLRMAARLCALLAGVAMLAGGLGVSGAWAVAAVAGLLIWPLLWGHLLTLTRPGSRIHHEVLGVGALISALPLGLIAVLMEAGLSLDSIVAFTTLLGMAVILPALLWVMDRFWQASGATPAEVEESLRRRCLELGFEEAPWPDGLRLLGHRRGRRTELRLQTRLAPARVIVEALLPEWPEGGGAGAPRAGEGGGQTLSDPLLARLLIVEGLPGADRILDGLHEPLLAILHAWPDSAIRDGRIQVVLPGPPFSPGAAGEARQTPRWMGVFVLEQLTAAVHLADLLAPRLVPELARCTTEEVLAPWRQRQTPGTKE
jgi:hypothetical protein